MVKVSIVNSDSGRPPKRENPVKNHSFRFTFCDDKRTPNFRDHTIIIEIFSKLCSYWLFQLEETKSGDKINLHYQGSIELINKTRSSTLGKSLNHVLFGVQFQPAYDSVLLQRYCMKDDTRIAGPWSSELSYTGQDLTCIIKQRLPWQEVIYQCVQQPPDSRKILVVIDVLGNSGKSKLAKFLVFRGLCLSLNFGNARDLLYLISKHLTKTCFLFDLTRSRPADVHMSDLFCAMESVKNGHIQSLKYQCNYSLFDPPHVLLFTNSIPDLHSVSSDRWSFFTVLDGELYHLSFSTIHDLAIYQGELLSKLQGRYDSGGSDGSETGDKISYERYSNLLHNAVRTKALVSYPCNFHGGAIVFGKKKDRF